MPLDECRITVVADGAGAFAVAGQHFGQQVAFGLADDFQPHGVIVVLLDVGNLDVAHNFAIVHHGEAAGPAIVVHAGLTDMGWASNNYTQGSAALVNFVVLGVGEIVAVFFHEADLLFQLVGSPQVVAIQEGDVLAAGFAEGTVATDGGSAVCGVLENADTGGWILRRFAPQDDAGRDSRNDALDYIHRVVSAAVVNDDQFPVGVCLSNHGTDRFGNESTGVVARHHNGN